MSDSFMEKVQAGIVIAIMASFLPFIWAIADFCDSHDAYNTAMSFIKRGIYGYWYNANGIGTLHRYYSYVEKADAAVSSMQIAAIVAIVCGVVLIGSIMAAVYLYLQEKYSDELTVEVVL